jgi:FtsZ-binding cell division protein ZapB
MLEAIMSRRIRTLSGLVALSFLLAAFSAGCLKIGGNEPLVKVTGSSEAPPVDTSRVPPISTVEEGRQRLAEAYARIDYLEKELNKARRDKEELKADLKVAKKERDAYKDRLKKLQGD